MNVYRNQPSASELSAAMAPMRVIKGIRYLGLMAAAVPVLDVAVCAALLFGLQDVVIIFFMFIAVPPALLVGWMVGWVRAFDCRRLAAAEWCWIAIRRPPILLALMLFVLPPACFGYIVRVQTGQPVVLGCIVLGALTLWHAWAVARDAVVLQLVIGQDGPVFLAHGESSEAEPRTVVPRVHPKRNWVRVSDSGPWLMLMGGADELAAEVRKARKPAPSLSAANDRHAAHPSGSRRRPRRDCRDG